MGGEVPARKGCVGPDGCVIRIVCEHMDVGRTSCVVARENRGELGDAVNVRLLYATQEIRIDV